jgi:hypothetical protein
MYLAPKRRGPADALGDAPRLQLGIAEVVAQESALAGVAQLANGVRLDLPNSLASDPEPPTDLLERERVRLLAQSVAKLEDQSLAARELVENVVDGLAEQVAGGDGVGRCLVVIGDQIRERGALVVADSSIERSWLLRRTADKLDALELQVERLGDLLVGWRTVKLGGQPTLGLRDLAKGLDEVDRKPDGARLVGNRSGDRLSDPPSSVG